MMLTQRQKKAVQEFLIPLTAQCTLPDDIDAYIREDRLTPEQLTQIQRHIDTVLFSVGKPAQIFRIENEKDFLRMQELAATAHYALRNLRAYQWYIS